LFLSFFINLKQVHKIYEKQQYILITVSNTFFFYVIIILFRETISIHPLTKNNILKIVKHVIPVIFNILFLFRQRIYSDRFTGVGYLIAVDLSKVERKKFLVNFKHFLGQISSQSAQKQHFPRSILGYFFGYLSLYSSSNSTISIARSGHTFTQSPHPMQCSISYECSPLYPSGIGIDSYGNCTVIGFLNKFLIISDSIDKSIFSPVHISRTYIQAPVNCRYIRNMCSFQ